MPNVKVQIVVMLNAVMESVIMLTVAAPNSSFEFLTNLKLNSLKITQDVAF